MNDIGKCPVCHAWVRPPAEAIGADDRFQCPQCASEYAASQWQSMDIPVLRLVRKLADEFPEPGSVPWENFPDPASEAFQILEADASADHEVAELDVAPLAVSTLAVSSRPRGPDETVASSATEPPAIEVPSPFIHSKQKTPRRQAPHPIRELAKIVAGGVAGLVIAQLILWWLPAPYRRDPFRLAPQIPMWLQFALPTELQTQIPRRVLTPGSLQDQTPSLLGSAAESANPFDDEKRLNRRLDDEPSRPIQVMPVRPAMTTEPAIDENPEVTPSILNRETDEPQQFFPDADLSSESTTSEATSGLAAWQDLDPSDAAILETFPATDALEAVNSDAEPNVPDFTGPPADDTSREVANLAPQTSVFYSGAELQSALGRVLSALDNVQALAGAPRDQRAEAARQMYQRLCDVAQTAAYVDIDDRHLGQRMNATDALLSRLAKDESLLNLIGRTAGDWISFPSRTSDGIAVAGEVMRIEQAGPYFESQLKLRSRDGAQVVRLLSTTPPDLDPRAPYAVGQQVLALGSIIANPESMLPAYQSAGPVIWRALHVVLTTRDSD